MSESEVKLLGAWFSPFALRVEMALKLKGVEYEFISQDLKNKSPLLLQHNPIHKKIPVLIHKGKSIAESTVILEYIDEVWEGPSILPKDPYDRAMARFWAKFIEDKCGDAMWKACWSEGEEREKAKEEAMEALKFLEDEVKDKKLFGGANVGLVDLVANFLSYWLVILQEVAGIQILTPGKFPDLCKWIDQYCSNSFVKDHLPDKERLTAYFSKAFETGNLFN